MREGLVVWSTGWNEEIAARSVLEQSCSEEEESLLTEELCSVCSDGGATRTQGVESAHDSLTGKRGWIAMESPQMGQPSREMSP